MAELKPALSSLGLEDVVTYIQSGNVVFRSDGGPTNVAAEIERQIADVFGLDVAVLLRTPPELRKIADGSPYAGEESDPKRLHVVFLDAAPEHGAIAELDPDRSPPDEFSVRGREIYLRLPNGGARTKLTVDYFERRLRVRATARNWNTLQKLIELAG